MPVWSFCIAANQHDPELGGGYVRAASLDRAFALVKHPDANLYPCYDDAWPSDEDGGEGVHFDRPVLPSGPANRTPSLIS